MTCWFNINKCRQVFYQVFPLSLILLHIYVRSRENNPMHPSSSSPEWLCGDMPAMSGQWRSSRIISVRTNRMFNKHKARSIITLIKTKIGS